MYYSKDGYFGDFGGAFLPEVLKGTIDELSKAYMDVREDEKFWNDYKSLVENYSARPTPLTSANNLSKHFGGANIYIKREDLNHTGAHKINNVLGQGLLAKRMGKKRVIAETGAGQHGIATATMAAKLGLECTIYMGAVDVERQYPNVFWMKNLGAEVIPVESGSQTLKDSMSAAMRDWSDSMDTTHYVIGTACGPSPFPELVSWFQSISGSELREQVLSSTGRMPESIYACVGGGSNALGVFSAFLEDPVELVGVEAGGAGIKSGKHAARISSKESSIGICQGYKSYFLQDSDGQMRETHSISAGLDYVGVSPIISHLSDSKRVRMTCAEDEAVIDALKLCMRKEGIIPALESAHAFAAAFSEASSYSPDSFIVINQSGRGDKDIFTVASALGDSDWKDFIAKKANSII